MVLRAPSPRSFAWLAGSLAWASVALGAVVTDGAQPLLRAPAPVVHIEPRALTGLEAYACVSCHAEVGAEWAESAHGLAWVDQVYQRDLSGKKRPELCTGCHAPEPLFAGVLTARPEAREELRELGVSCESCHMDEQGAVLGPRGTATEAHASKSSAYMNLPGSNELCSSCHSTNVGPVLGIAKDFVAGKLAERGLSCVGCHMAPLERAWATDAPPRLGRSHALQTPRDPSFLRQAFRLEWTNGVLRVKNQAGHRVPGLEGRKLVIQAELLGPDGTGLEVQEFTLDERAYLPLDGQRELRFTRAGVALRVKGLHHDPRAREPVTFLDETLTN